MLRRTAPERNTGASIRWRASSAGHIPPAAVRCNLEKQDYTMIVSLGCTIPLKEIGQETYPVTVLVNGENAGTMVIDDTNNGQSVSLDISGDLLNEGANVITYSPSCGRQARSTRLMCGFWESR